MKKIYLVLLALFFSPLLFADVGDVTVIATISPRNGAFQNVVRSTNVYVDTSTFSHNLSTSDYNLQHALSTIDQLTVSGGGGSASLSGPDTGLLSKNGAIAISSSTLTYNTTSNLLTIGATTQFSSVSTTSWTNVSTMTFGNGSALVFSTSTALQLPSGQVLTNGSSVTVQGVFYAGTNITFTTAAGSTTINSSASGSGGGGYAMEPATVTIQSAKGEKASTMTITSLSPGVMHIIIGSSNVVTGLVSLSTEVTGILPSTSLGSGSTNYIQVTNSLQNGSTFFVNTGSINGNLALNSGAIVSTMGYNTTFGGIVVSTSIQFQGQIVANSPSVAVSTINYGLVVGGHVEISSSTPVVSSCGSSPSIVGNDMAGKVTIGGGVVTSCTITFAAAWTNGPACWTNSNTALTSFTATTTNTVFTLAAGATFGGDVIMYGCLGYK